MLSQALSAGNYAATDARRHAASAGNDGVGATRFFRQVPDLVNGADTDLVHIYVGAGLGEPWRWVPDAMFALIVTGEGITVTDASVRTRVVAEAVFHSLALTADGTPEARARGSALLLAAGRVSMRRAWGIADADVVATQVMDVTVPPVVIGAGVAGRAAGLTAAGQAPADVTANITFAAYNTEFALLATMYDLLADGAILAAMQAGVGMLASNGVTLVTTLIHHYVSPHKQICDAVYLQFFRDDIDLPAGMSVEQTKDVVCHKTAHVVETARAVGVARSPDARRRLEIIGQGAATVRMPAKFEAERAAEALQAVVRKGASATANANVAVDQDPVNDLVTAVSATMTANPNAQGTLLAKAQVATFKSTYGYGVAWLAGYLNAMYNDIAAKPRARSAINARTLEGLIEDFEEAYAEGNSHFSLAMKWRKARAKEGFLDGQGLFGAAVPRAFGIPEVRNAADVNAGGAPVPGPGGGP